MKPRRKVTAVHKAAAAMDKAVDAVLADPATRTVGLGGAIKTKASGEQVAGLVS